MSRLKSRQFKVKDSWYFGDPCYSNVVYIFTLLICLILSQTLNTWEKLQTHFTSPSVPYSSLSYCVLVVVSENVLGSPGHKGNEGTHTYVVFSQKNQINSLWLMISSILQRHIDAQAPDQPGVGGGPGSRHRAHQLSEEATVCQLLEEEEEAPTSQ